MSWFFSPKTSEPKSFGVNLPDNKVAEAEMKDIVDAYRKREAKAKDTVHVATKLKSFSNKLAGAYVHNYKIMVDMGNLLHQYAEFFQQIKDLLSKSDLEYDQLNAQSFENLEKLTRREMDRFTTKFNEQADRVRRLFMTYNMSEQADKLSAVPQMTGNVSRAAEETYDLLRQGSSPRYGGTQKYLKKASKESNNGRGKKTQRQKAEGR